MALPFRQIRMRIEDRFVLRRPAEFAVRVQPFVPFVFLFPVFLPGPSEMLHPERMAKGRQRVDFEGCRKRC